MSLAKFIEEAALALREAESHRKPCSPVRQLIGEQDIESAYKVQEINVDWALENGKSLCGSKIGLTSAAVQKQLGVDQPDFGVLYSHTQIENNAKISSDELMQPKAEAEIAFVLKSGFDQPVSNIQQVIDATDYICASIEVVGSRVANWDIRITDTIADNASASHFVLGDLRVSAANFDFVNCEMKLLKNGEIASQGNGAACMGNPLNAVMWLANTRLALGNPLKAGEIILSGALGPMVASSSGDVFTAEIGGLGSVTFSIID
jgi:2-keto-4-pentenoate hydratase